MMLFGSKAAAHKGVQIGRFRPVNNGNIRFLLSMELLSMQGAKLEHWREGVDILVLAHPTVLEQLSWTLDADVINTKEIERC